MIIGIVLLLLCRKNFIQKIQQKQYGSLWSPLRVSVQNCASIVQSLSVKSEELQDC